MPFRVLMILILLGILVSTVSKAQTTSAERGLPLSQLLEQGRRHLNQEQSSEAFALFKLYEAMYAGQLTYDYWYGVIAVRDGRPFEATVALERAIAKQPLHAGARLEIVAAYLQLERYDAAEQQLNYLDTLNPPPRAQEAIMRFQEVIAKRRTMRNRNEGIFSITLDTGYDSNYLNYPDSFDLFADTILEGLAILESEGTSYNNLRGLGWKRWKSSQGTFVEASLLGQLRINHNDDASVFNTRILHGKLSFGTELNKNSEIKFGLEASYLWLDKDPYRTHTGLHLGWKRQINDNSELIINGAFREFRFDQRRNDYVSWSGDLEWRKAITKQLSWRNKVGVEQETVTYEITRQGGNSKTILVSTHLDYTLNNKNKLHSTLSYERQKYNDKGLRL